MKCLVTPLLLLFFSLPASLAQEVEQWQIIFRSRCVVVTDSGQYKNRIFTDRDIIRHCLEQNGMSVTNARKMILIYKRGSDPNGDEIQVVNRKNGTVYCTPFRILFSEELQGPGAKVKALGFVYQNQGDAVGSALLEHYPVFDFETGETRLRISGDLQYVDKVYHGTKTAICVGRLVTVRKVNFTTP